MNNCLEDRFDTELAKQTFTYFELVGFKTQPNLAIKVGMAIGYGMALDDFKKRFENIINGMGDIIPHIAVKVALDELEKKGDE